ncbi:MAG: UTRA domain-containing protein [Nocardioides sp.]
MEARGIDQRSEVLAADRRTDAEAAARLGLAEDAELVYLERVRLGDDVPIAWDRAWLVADLGEPLLGVDLTHTALYDEWQRAAGVRLTGGREWIRAVVPTPEERSRLGMKRGEAAMLIERLGCLTGRPVEFRITMMRGSRFTFSAEWESGRSYQVDIAQPPAD